MAEAERLLTLAEETTGPEARQAAVRAVDAARRLAESGDRTDHGRLLRALARLGVVLALGPAPDDARPVVREVVAIARSLIAPAAPDDPVRADAIIRLAQAGQMLTALGDPYHGQDTVEEAWAAVTGATGPHGRRARAVVLTALVQARVDEQEERVAHARDVPDAAGTMRLAVALAEEPYDRAEALSLLGRAALAVDRPDITAAAWAEQMAILAGFDDDEAHERAARTADAIVGLHRAYPRIEIVAPGPGAPSYAERWAAPPPAPPDDAVVLAALGARLDHAIAMSRGGARLAEAETRLDALVPELTAQETAARGTPAHPDYQRLLARTMWRLSLVRHAAGRPESALEPARLSVAFAVALADGMPPAETITFMCDAGEVAHAAGHPDERVALLTDAVARGEEAAGQEPSEAVRRALGTALHNLATAHTTTLSAPGAGDRDSRLLAETVVVAARARTIRRALAGPADPMTIWEYANTLLMSVGVDALHRRWQDGVLHLVEAVTLLRRLGPAAAPLHRRARAHAQMLQIVAPRLVARARADGRWP